MKNIKEIIQYGIVIFMLASIGVLGYRYYKLEEKISANATYIEANRHYINQINENIELLEEFDSVTCECIEQLIELIKE